MKSRTIFSFLILSFVFTTLMMVANANAIPAFARKYKLSCTTCHAPIPKLKPYGEEFAGNGFILKEDEKARNYITAGDDKLWLNRDFPIAVRFDAYAVFDEDKTVNNDLQGPWGLKLLSGGTLYKNIGYYFYFYLSERGEVAGIEDAYIHFDNVFGTNLDIMVGQFQTSDPLMKRELRLTFEDYKIYKLRVGQSRADLAYDRGVILSYTINKTGTDLFALVVNGNGKGEAGPDKKFDDDKYKNYAFRINQGLGEKASVGFYYYKGREAYTDWSYRAVPDNKLTYFGPDFNVNLGYFEVTAQYLLRKDTNPYFASVANEVEGKGLVVEAILSPYKDRSNFFLTLLYNKIDHDIKSFDYHTITLNGTYLVARNLRLAAEFTRDIEYKSNRVALGLVSGF